MEKAEHELKTWPNFFEWIWEGRKKHEIRRCVDREFSIGDRILLREWDPNPREYTGRWILVRITYITPPGTLDLIPHNTIVFSFERITRGELDGE